MFDKLLCSLFFIMIPLCQAEEKYDTSLLEDVGGVKAADISYFDKGNDILSGKYILTLTVNDQELGNETITYKEIDDNKVSAVFSCKLLKHLKIKIDKCLVGEHPLSDYINEVTLSLDLNENRLNITVPQKYIEVNNFDDIANQSDWSDGITAAYSNYSLHIDDTRTQSGNSKNDVYGNFSNGLNLGGFRFRNDGYLNEINNRHTRYTSSTSYVEHDLDRLRSTLTLGDFFTSGQFFNSQNIRGLALSTNTSMLKSYELSYTPVIAGVARSNATVIIRQNGFVISTRKVTPGPFSFKDIPASSSAGDLDITIMEANGGIQHFVQSYNSVDVLVPKNVLRYNIYSGRNRAFAGSPQILEGDFIYGLSNTLTLISGVQYASHYSNFSSGFGANLRWLGGAYVVVNSSKTDNLHGLHSNGRQLKWGLTHSFTTTASYINITGEYKLSEGYREFSDAKATDPVGTYKSRYTIQLNQPVGPIDVSMNLTQQYGFHGEKSQSFGGNTGFSIFGFQVITSITHQNDAGNKVDNLISLNFSRTFGSKQRHFISYDQSQSSAGQNDSRLSLSGSVLDDDSLSYDVGISNSDGNRQFDSSFNWLSSKGGLSGGWSQDNDSKQLNLGAEGSIVAHHHGVTLGQPISQGSVLVHTDHVSDLGISNVTGVHTDYFGNAIVTGLSPYRYNDVAISTEGLKRDVEVDRHVAIKTPRNGTIVEADFEAHNRKVHYAIISTTSGEPLPFGSTIYDTTNHSVGMVSAGGLVALEIQDRNWPYHVHEKGDDDYCQINIGIMNRKTRIWNLKCK